MMNKVLDMSTQSSNNNNRIAKILCFCISNAVLDGCIVVYEAMFIARMLK